MLRVVSETTSSRLLTLLSLLQGRRDWPGSELADRLDVSARTVRRDVERLRSLGYPVESMTGPAGGYQLRAGTAMPPLLLDDDEAIAIAVSLRTAAGGSVVGIEETAVRALVKLEQVLPSHLRRRVQALSGATQTLQVYGGPQVDPQSLTVLAAACRDHERVRFAYTARDRAGTRREVEPHALVNAGRRWYLVAFDCGRDDWRTFRVDRIEKPAVGRHALHPARAAGQGRGRLRRQEPAVLPLALRGASHGRVPGVGPRGPALVRRRPGRARREPLRAAHVRRQPRLAGGADRDAARALHGPRAARTDRAPATDRRPHRRRYRSLHRVRRREMPVDPQVQALLDEMVASGRAAL